MRAVEVLLPTGGQSLPRARLAVLWAVGKREMGAQLVPFLGAVPAD